MTDAIARLIEAAEAILVRACMQPERDALRAAIAPAREEWERMRAERDKFKRLDREAASRVESVICMRSDHFTGEEPYVGWRDLGQALREDYDELSRLRSELEAARAPMVVTTEAVDAACGAWFESNDFDDENRLGMDGALHAALPHLRPAALPTHAQIVDELRGYIVRDECDSIVGWDDAATAILALMGGKG